MSIKKEFFLACSLFLLLILLFSSGVSAINLNVEKKTISNTVVAELNEPAEFELTITNNEADNKFQIYSLVGVDIHPEEFLNINEGESRKVKIELYPQDSVKKKLGFYTFEYKIRNQEEEIQEFLLTINLVDLKNAFDFYADSFIPTDNYTIVHFNNKGDFNFTEINALISSNFFTKNIDFSLKPHEKKEILADIDKEKSKTTLAGTYLLNARIMVDGEKETLSSVIKFLEQSGIETQERTEGILIKRTEIEKKNKGNIPVDVVVSSKKNLFSALFTTFNTPPASKRTEGFSRVYTWTSNVIPDESLTLVIKTNFLLPVIIILALVIIYFLASKYLTSDLILKKRAGFVKTKGGEFALKITIIAKARRFVEKIRIIDRVPASLTIYNKFGSIAPDRIDEKNRRIEWNLESLNKGEERVLSYIVYSKIGVIGKFELPETNAIYESNGKVKETSSNQAFFISEAVKE